MPWAGATGKPVRKVCLVHESNKRGFRTAAHLPLAVNYDGQRIDLGFRIDILVESTVVVEIKAVDAITPVHHAQLITFLKLSRKHVGLLIKFTFEGRDSTYGLWGASLHVLCG